MVVRARERVETDIEGKILTGMIISDKFCRDINPAVNLSYFRVDHIRRIVKWTMDYYRKYQQAPVAHIQDVFNAQRSKLEPAEAELIRQYMETLSSQYELDTALNTDYLLDQAVGYFKKRSLEAMVDNVRDSLTAGDVTKAESCAQNYRTVAKTISDWVNPFSPENVDKVLLEEDDGLLQFPGKLGDLLGPFKRDWLIGFMGPMKRGKTWWLQEVAIQALMSRCRVVFISLEMNWKTVAARFFKRITATGDNTGVYVYPCMDCFRNQTGTCTRPSVNTNTVVLRGPEDARPMYDRENPYRPCVLCRNDPRYYKHFLPEMWYTPHTRPGVSSKEINRKTKAMSRLYGDNLRVMSYPAYAANLADLQRDLETLEYVEEFLPDVIVVDYADILKPEDPRETGRDKIELTWKMLKNLAQAKHCLVVTASQSTRDSISKKTVTQQDTAEDIRKLAIVDAMFSLNQTPKEKKRGFMRFGVMIHRHQRFDEFEHIHVLQQLELGQPLLDSDRFYVPKRPEDEE